MDTEAVFSQMVDLLPVAYVLLLMLYIYLLAYQLRRLPLRQRLLVSLSYSLMGSILSPIYIFGLLSSWISVLDLHLQHHTTEHAMQKLVVCSASFFCQLLLFVEYTPAIAERYGWSRLSAQHRAVAMVIVIASFAFGVSFLSSILGISRKSIYGQVVIFYSLFMPLFSFNCYKWLGSFGRNPAGNLSRSLNLLEQLDQSKLDDKSRQHQQKLLTRAKRLDSRLKLLSNAKIATFFWNLDVRNIEREVGVLYGALPSKR